MSRTRVELSRIRRPASTPPPTPARPTWRDDSDSWLLIRYWLARYGGFGRRRDLRRHI